MVINLTNSTMPYYSTESSAAASPDNSTTDSLAINAFAEIPLTALGKTTRRQLSHLLNSRKILRSEEGYERDWRGIAALAQQKYVCEEQMLSGDDPMSKVLQLWCSHNPKTATFFNLERFLGIIDRWDVSDDIYENLIEDAKVYNTKQQQQLKTPNDPLDTKHANDTQTDDFGLGSDANILTNDDVLRAQQGLPPQKYDAFVLYADADINYATEMIAKLEEGTDQTFKLCLKDRNLLAGISFTHVALTQLIEERCKHLIVIFTEEFMRSPENKFLVDYTQALQIQNKTRKIIPLIYEDSVNIPRTLKIYTHLRYNANAGGLYNFWGKLASSIRNVNISTDTTPSIYTKKLYTNFAASQQQNSVCDTLKVKSTPAPPPTEIPSININGHCFVSEDFEVPQKQERQKFKKRGFLRSSDKKLVLSNKDIVAGLRNAHSTSQLHVGCKDVSASLSDLSTTSGYCEMKKKKKWPGKLFKKVFSRSSTKLQEPA